MAELYSFNLKGVLDDCLEFIDQVVPANTKFSSSLRRVPARTPTFKWVSDLNDAIVSKHGQVEGIEADSANTTNGATMTRTNQAEESNYAQRFSKFVTVSKSAAATGVHGRVSETQYQLEKAVKALKNQIEKTFLSDQTKVAATATVAALTDGVFAQLPINCKISGAVDAANVKKLLDQLFVNGSDADTLMCGKDVFEGLSKLSNGYVDGVKIEGKPVPSFVDAQGNVYGVISSRYIPDGCLFAYNSKDWSIVVFRDWKISQLDTKGSYDQYLVECEVGLRHDGKFMSGVIEPAAASPAPEPENVEQSDAEQAISFWEEAAPVAVKKTRKVAVE